MNKNFSKFSRRLTENHAQNNLYMVPGGGPTRFPERKKKQTEN
jgi:hypothetical protein